LALSHQFADKEELLRPSVQLPAGIHGWRGLYGFWPALQGKAVQNAAFAAGLGRPRKGNCLT